MKKLPVKVFKFGNLTITRMTDEIVVLYRSEKKFFLKKFFIRKVRHGVYIALLAMALTSLLFVFPFSHESTEDKSINQLETVTEEIEIRDSMPAKTSVEEDEEQKNAVLLSQQTDYIEEKKNKPLTISLYKVKPGDTLSEIAKEHGVSMDTICGSNGLTSYDFIHQGRVLKIPNKDGLLHKVKKGQKLFEIAKKYKVDPDKIVDQNDLDNADFLAASSYLFVPDAKPQNIIVGFLWPTVSRRVTSAYGWRLHPILRVRKFHTGIDLRSKYQNVRATKYGKVTFAGWLGGYGKAIVLAHPGGYKSLYGHLSRIYVKRGQYVKQGQYVARSGNTGRSSGPHLHFEIIKNGKHVNPRRYIK